MSVYLSNYYCGNMENKCNYQEPLDYKKITDRQFIDTFSKKVEECEKMKGVKGLCCSNNKENNNIMDGEYIKEINNKINTDMNMNMNNYKIIKNIPLIRVNKNEGNIESIDICNCGGTDNYKECIEERCNGYKKPTRYEYCKLGNYNNPECIIENTPGISNDNINRCKLKPLTEDRINIKINNLVNDCYLNNCKEDNLDSLKNRYTTDDKYFKLGDSVKSYGYNKKPEIGKSLSDYFKKN